MLSLALRNSTLPQACFSMVVHVACNLFVECKRSICLLCATEIGPRRRGCTAPLNDGGNCDAAVRAQINRAIDHTLDSAIRCQRLARHVLVLQCQEENRGSDLFRSRQATK